jgi:hypothetical protein
MRRPPPALAAAARLLRSPPPPPRRGNVRGREQQEKREGDWSGIAWRLRLRGRELTGPEEMGLWSGLGHG